MSIEAGERLGRYQIEARLGRGGMGEVYRALDTRLGRPVAVKVLTAGIAADEGSRVRFEHEARTISRLDHPNICTLYDVGETAGMPFLVMQFIEGQTLADAAAGGRLPPADVLRIASDLGSALSYAHRSGVLHRDIKPGNVMLLPDGRAILLDFGIAKAGPLVAADAPTTDALVAPLTMAGGVLGTVEYMSPEQLGGAPLDARSDIFSLGLVLYELAAGRHPFKRQTIPLTASAILTDPYPHLSVPGVPAGLDHVLERMLAKTPAARYVTMADCLAALRGIEQEAPAGLPSPVATPRRRRWAALSAAVAVVAVLAAAAIWNARDSATVVATTPPVPSTAAPSSARIRYWLDVAPGAGPRDTFVASLGDETFAGGSRFRVNVLAPEAGYVYLVGDEAPGADNPTGLALLFHQAPGARGEGLAAGHTQSGWFVFAGPPATEHLWIVWSRREVPELAALTSLVNDRDRGLVRDREVARAARARLGGGAPPSETRDAAAMRATLESTADIVVRRLELRHG